MDSTTLTGLGILGILCFSFFVVMINSFITNYKLSKLIEMCSNEQSSALQNNYGMMR